MNGVKVLIIALMAILLISPIGIAQLPNESNAAKNILSVRSPAVAAARILPSPYPVIPMVVGNGFAFSGNEFHSVRLDVVGKWRIPVSDLRPMIMEGKNLSWIKEAIVKPEGVIPAWKGHLKFGVNNYALKVTELDKKHLKADILAYPVRPLESNINVTSGASMPKVAGSLSIEIKPYEGALIGTGKIMFTADSSFEGKEYDVYLHISPDRPYIESLLKPVITSSAKDTE